MLNRVRFSGVLLVALGVVLGYLVATGRVPPLVQPQRPRPSAKQPTGVPGSPSATTPIDGRYLPTPPQTFKGEITPNALQSKPYWPARVVPPKGAPSVLLIMTDDTGSG